MKNKNFFFKTIILYILFLLMIIPFIIDVIDSYILNYFFIFNILLLFIYLYIINYTNYPKNIWSYTIISFPIIIIAYLFGDYLNYCLICADGACEIAGIGALFSLIFIIPAFILFFTINYTNIHYLMLLIVIIYLGIIIDNEILINFPFFVILFISIGILVIGFVQYISVLFIRKKENKKLSLEEQYSNIIVILGISFIIIVILGVLRLHSCNRLLHYLTDIFYTGPSLIALGIGSWFIHSLKSNK